MADEALRSELTTLKEARIFFGHHSVGVNLLEGVAALAREAGVAVTIGEGSVGANTYPKSKFEAWAQKAEAGIDADLMVMKLCYVDVTPSTNVDELVASYRGAVERVRHAKPGVKILHVTTPLTVRGDGLKNWLKRSFGRSVWDDDANAKRLAYNRALVAAFPGEPIFDLATIESTRPDGSREEHVVGGTPVPMLWPGYSDDGSHLNEQGKRMAGRAFVAALAAALR
ncbi:MAG: SGNH/GDSL hydrolase family protein [Deltaproteobacteria bacterium]|nr:SGNH/GDSL hydrolase family protein [Deltaproteobacteria bacterium]